MNGDARDLFARFIPDGDMGRFAEGLPAMLLRDFSGAMKILRDKDFQMLLTDYPRAKRTFIVAPGVTDEVESEWLIRAGAGAEYRPEDYLQLFERFIAENADQISAINILLSRPREWGAEPLRELREKLAQSTERFTEANLQRAYQLTRNKALVDIISMIKRTASDSSPLLTAEERVDAAIARVTAGRELTEEQAKWMERIRQHLVQNLSIEPQDFDDIPVLLDRGGWGRANRTFDGQLTELLGQLNEELVAA
jgi:type I restriction enzyme R subunit